MPTQIGQKAPDFKLPGVDGKNRSLGNFAGKSAVAVIFSCNHCPYVQAYEGRMINLQEDFGPRGFQLVAINSNDAVTYPEDKFDKMVERAKRLRFNFPYLRDETQDIAKAFGATRTPHVFLLDREHTIKYMGGIDDNWENPSQARRHYLADAIESLLKGKTPEPAETLPVGCTVKWRK